MIHHGILKDDPRARYTIDKIRDIIKTMVLDKVLEEVKSTGTGEFIAVRAGTMCYRLVTRAPQGGMMEGIPCGVCPRIDECSPERVMSPSTCVYYYKWLQMDFKAVSPLLLYLCIMMECWSPLENSVSH
ncbi:unnamed protein product [Miscanthus lutarioriparius]|uniref:DNA-directed RNA polymerase III subunit RPC6 n=1 Tax=Miscanthus lutarioriparius TaxID=422564 RepID=A0A811S1Z8_9POAL|nr:unnamed protein product [Miscanthus lutarioriparius]